MILMNNFKGNKKAQVAIYVIIAIVLVVAIAIYFIFLRPAVQPEIAKELVPVYTYLEGCLADSTLEGINLLEAQGGVIETPEFLPGSEYFPGSSQLDFFGFPVPYWYYTTGNGLVEEQVPTKIQMQNQLGNFIADRLRTCDFASFIQQGYAIEYSVNSVSTKISDASVEADANAVLTVSFANKTSSRTVHKTSVSSKLGALYNTALDIYNKEKASAFLESYGVDVMRLYTPVDGVEISCSPKIWKMQDIENDFKNALEANTMFLKVKGDYYTLRDKKDEYFVVDVASDYPVNFLYSGSWPTKIEVSPEENGMLIGEPVGNQQGLGALGFCYITYHFVYDISYPVMIRVGGEEVFQFPVNVIIAKNMPRAPLPGTQQEGAQVPLCDYKVENVTVNVYDKNFNAIPANISFECFGQSCNIGQADENGLLQAGFPQCVNGRITVQAEGYAEKKEIVSTNIPVTADIIMDKLYEVNLEVQKNGIKTDSLAIISFESEGNSVTVVYPEQKTVKLSEGLYNITAYIYSNTTLVIPEERVQHCFEVPRAGVLGILGLEKTQCTEIVVPQTELGNALSAGGKAVDYFILKEELTTGKLTIGADGFAAPKSMEEVERNFGFIETAGLDIKFG